MTGHDRGRRRFIVTVVSAIGVALAGGLGWLLTRLGLRDGEVAAVSNTTRAPTPPAPSSTTASVPPAASTTRPPTTTTTQPATTTTESPTTPSTGVPASLISVICKAAWGGAEPTGEFEAHTIERLTLHHTASFLEANTSAPRHVRGHQRFHQRDRGWPDLAYHFIIDLNGHVYEGRPLWARGDTATSYDPMGHFLVCCEGDFDKQKPSKAQMTSLVDVLAWAATEFAVDPETLRGHRDLASTSCPGKNLYSRLTDGSILSRTEKRIAQGAPRLEVSCGAAAEQLVADIEAGLA